MIMIMIIMMNIMMIMMKMMDDNNVNENITKRIKNISILKKYIYIRLKFCFKKKKKGHN